VAGWAAAPEALREHPLTVQFKIDGVLIGNTRTDLVRADVANAGLGPRMSGFRWVIPPR
jgi:hypothetical protein